MKFDDGFGLSTIEMWNDLSLMGNCDCCVNWKLIQLLELNGFLEINQFRNSEFGSEKMCAQWQFHHNYNISVINRNISGTVSPLPDKSIQNIRIWKSMATATSKWIQIIFESLHLKPDTYHVQCRIYGLWLVPIIIINILTKCEWKTHLKT